MINTNFRYHSAPSSGPVIHIYDTANSEYLEVVNQDSMCGQSDAEYKKGYESASTSSNTDDNYEEID